MVDEIILDVPFSEKEEAKSLGARWNSGIKKWYIPKGQDASKFKKWIPEDSDDPGIVVKPPIYLLKSRENCWKCGKDTDVFCLGSNGLMDDEMDLDMFCTYSNLSFVPDKLKQILRNVAPSYYMDYTKQSNSSYYVNHCECGAKLGDFYMHNEPDGAFFPLPEEQAQTILMYQLDIEDESIEIKASYGTNDTDFIPKYAQKEKLQQ